MISPSIPSESPLLRTHGERGRVSVPVRDGPVPLESDRAAADRPIPAKVVTAAPMVPDPAALAAHVDAGRSGDASFAVSAHSLGELLARINISGAGVAARLRDATRRVQIASLGPSVDTAGHPLVARLRVSDGAFGATAQEIEIPAGPAAASPPTAGAPLRSAPPPGLRRPVAPAAPPAKVAHAESKAPVPTGDGQASQPNPGSLVDVIG